MKKILLIANYRPSNGGISGQIDVLLEKLNKEGYNTTLFNTKKNNFIRLFLPIILILKGRKSDIFHVHGCSGLGFYPIIIGLLVGSLLNKKNVVTYHGGGLKEFIEKHPKLIKSVLSKAQIITAPSAYISAIFDNYNLKSITLPNIIRRDNVSFKERTKIEPKLICSRSFEKVYNIPMLINGFRIIKKKYSEAQLHLIGDGSLREELESMVEEYKLNDVFFYGRVQNAKMGETLNKADIYINPSRKDNMPLSLFEALACGLPLISTKVGGIPDFIKNDINGYLIPSNDVEILVETVETVINNYLKTQTIIKNGYELFENYTWNVLKNDYMILYK